MMNTKMMNIAHKWVKKHFAKYVVIDDCGTRIHTWTLRGAYEWLPYCSGFAQVYDTYLFVFVASRRIG